MKRYDILGEIITLPENIMRERLIAFERAHFGKVEFDVFNDPKDTDKVFVYIHMVDSYGQYTIINPYGQHIRG